MSNHHHEGDSKSFTLPVFLSFALVFCLFVLMARCSGPYKPVDPHAAGHGTEHKTEHKTEHATEHKAGDTTTHKAVDTSAHKTEKHEEAHH